ncbi:uncharacterized protein LY89DRAFT_753614 [Mollisia scopiformis]|uniref:Uncharacterized protein n=1 Tax=Mollisia scopiformis TaxID=149040 RepID=A0A194X1P8_MOLSC|nr:uncharacterized protein LY89DRAFT_753614 [Mollisia scopiformis]KUJ14121.1 hypothetical protein LY89DRAFT_753614 [Mollisia scopiformis]
MSSPPLLLSDATIKVRTLFNALQSRLQSSARVDIPSHSIQKCYETPDAEALPVLEEGSLLGDALEKGGVDLLDNWWMTAIHTRPCPDAFVNAIYIHYFNSKDGVIVVWDVDKECDMNASIDRLQWSDLLFQHWQQFCICQDGAVWGLRFLAVKHVQNPDTSSVLSSILGSTNDQDTVQKTFRPGHESFFALLGTPNLKGVVRMLTEHCAGIGYKNIHSIQVLKQRNAAFDFLLALEQAPIPNERRPSVQEPDLRQGRKKNQLSKSKQKRLERRA